MPSLLEYLSYNCNFMGILAGPTCSYNDYMAFIDGTCYQPRHQENANGRENGKCKQSEPSPKVLHRYGAPLLRNCCGFLQNKTDCSLWSEATVVNLMKILLSFIVCAFNSCFTELWTIPPLPAAGCLMHTDDQ